MPIAAVRVNATNLLKISKHVLKPRLYLLPSKPAARLSGRSRRGSLGSGTASVGGEFFGAEDVVIQQAPTAGGPIQEHRHQGSAKGQALRDGYGDQPGVGEQEDRQQVTGQRDSEVQRRGPDIESLLPGGALELEATGRTRLMHLEDLSRHKERLAPAVRAAVGQTTGEDVDAGDVHAEKPET